MAQGMALPAQFGNAFLVVAAVHFGIVQQVVGLVALPAKCQVQKISRFLDAEHANVGGAILFGNVALLDLLEVAQPRFGLAFADGEGAVAKVDEHFAALQAVAGNGFHGVALGGMRQRQD